MNPTNKKPVSTDKMLILLVHDGMLAHDTFLTLLNIALSGWNFNFKVIMQRLFARASTYSRYNQGNVLIFLQR